MADLDEEIERVRELGISYSLSDRAIDECLLKAINRHITVSSIESHVSRKQRRSPSRLCLLLKIAFAPILLFMALYTLASFHTPTERFLGKYTANATYPFFRYVRFITLPLARNFDMSFLHGTECLIANPFFAEPLVECDMCMEVKAIKIMTKEKADRTIHEYLGTAEPVLIRDGFEEEISFEELRMTYMENEHTFDQHPPVVFSTIETITDSSVLFENYTENMIKNIPNFHAEWYPVKVSQAQVVRTIFKRPSFVPQEAEIALEKGIFIDHPKSKPYSVMHGHYPNNYFIQAFGKRRMMLVPHEHCTEVCETQSIILKPRDILYFHDAFWTLDTLPVFGRESSKDVSIGYMATFA